MADNATITFLGSFAEWVVEIIGFLVVEIIGFLVVETMGFLVVETMGFLVVGFMGFLVVGFMGLVVVGFMGFPVGVGKHCASKDSSPPNPTTQENAITVVICVFVLNIY